MALPPGSQLLRPSLSELFLTNLRLLNLDKKSDWPNITPRTFATKDGKLRITCTEWALFRLFELWDPEEARDVYTTSSIVDNAVID
jgi:hypothetical protein